MKDVQTITEDTSLKEIIMRHRYDLLNRYGFFEGEDLLPEEHPFIAVARDALVDLLGIVNDRWQACPGRADCPYVYFKDLKTGKTTYFYSMTEEEQSVINLKIDEIEENLP